MMQQPSEQIALTPKGEAYAAMHRGMGAHTSIGRAELEAEVERLIAILDAWDGDPDLEPTLGAPNSSPGWIDAGSQTFWAAGSNADGEAEDVCEDEGAHDGAEASLGWTEDQSMAGDFFVHLQHGLDEELVDEDGGDVLDEPHDANTSEGCEPDPGELLSFPNGSHIPGGGSGI